MFQENHPASGQSGNFAAPPRSGEDGGDFSGEVGGGGFAVRYYPSIIKRTTIEIDDDLLNRAKEALGEATARATVEEALRRAAATTETERERRAAKQRRYLEQLSLRMDVAMLASEEMWR